MNLNSIALLKNRIEKLKFMIFLNYMNAFRAIAIFCIVAAHAKHIFSWENNINQEKILNLTLGNSTVFFVFISGYLFQYLLSKFEVYKYYLSKTKYVLLPYLIISIPAIFYFTFISPKEFLPPSFFSQPLQIQIFTTTAGDCIPLQCGSYQ